MTARVCDFSTPAESAPSQRRSILAMSGACVQQSVEVRVTDAEIVDGDAHAERPHVLEGRPVQLDRGLGQLEDERGGRQLETGRTSPGAVTAGRCPAPPGTVEVDEQGEPLAHFPGDSPARECLERALQHEMIEPETQRRLVDRRQEPPGREQLAVDRADAHQRLDRDRLDELTVVEADDGLEPDLHALVREGRFDDPDAFGGVVIGRRGTSLAMIRRLDFVHPRVGPGQRLRQRAALGARGEADAATDVVPSGLGRKGLGERRLDALGDRPCRLQIVTRQDHDELVAPPPGDRPAIADRLADTRRAASFRTTSPLA